MIARLTVQREGVTEYPLAEKVDGGWQNGTTFYPDTEVTEVQELDVRLLPPDEPDPAPDECTSEVTCTAPVHTHGCRADIGNCDHPAAHPTPTELRGETGHVWPCPLYWPANWTPDALPLTTCAGACTTDEREGDTDD